MYHIDLNESYLTYSYKKVRGDKDNVWDFLTIQEPAGPMYLVRVEGETGDSNGNENTFWDVELFHNRADAEALADKIDLGYDLFSVLDRVAVKNAGPDRIAEIEKVIKHLEGMKRPAFDAYRSAHITAIEYDYEGRTLTVGPSWYGYFDSLYEVSVLEIMPGNKNHRRWRNRRHFSSPSTFIKVSDRLRLP